jgi:WD40 repeat protein
MSYPHPTGEIWSMASHPKSNMVATCGGGVLLSEMGVVGEEERGAAESECLKGGKLVDFATKIWKLSMDDEDDFGLSPRLEPLITISHGENVKLTNAGWEKRVGCILWNPLLSSDDTSEEQVSASLLTVGWEANSPISLWNISAGAAVEVWSAGQASPKAGGRRKTFMPLQSALPRRASWDPHEVSNILVTSGQDVVAYDTRVAAHNGVGVIRNAHRYGVADVDHNRLQENVVVTSGLDGTVKFWDLRMHLSSNHTDASFIPSPKLLKIVRGGHSNWTTRAIYNPYYDQLVLSGGSDGIANLWRVSSCSSAPLLEFDGEDDEIDNTDEVDDGLPEEGNYDEAGNDWAKEEKEEYIQDNPSGEDNKQTEKNDATANPSSNDVRVSRFECSDTTADVCWSASDPWMYASLSCDGTLVVHHVPSKEKYKILL